MPFPGIQEWSNRSSNSICSRSISINYDIHLWMVRRTEGRKEFTASGLQSNKFYWFPIDFFDLFFPIRLFSPTIDSKNVTFVSKSISNMFMLYIISAGHSSPPIICTTYTNSDRFLVIQFLQQVSASNYLLLLLLLADVNFNHFLW